MIELRTINEDNYQECFRLKASVKNENFVDSVTYSLAEAWVFYKDTKPFAIYDNDKMIGFVSIYVGEEYNADTVSVPVDLGNMAALKFWKKIGFIFSDSIEDGYAFMRLYLS